ncbi:MAG: glucuronate isomerase [Oscillospiraceae bacterium]
MKPFLNDDFLLTTATAGALYHEYAETLPIVDYHCHVSPREIFEDRHFENLTQLWLSGDHYKWRLMRANGVDESFITGSAPDREKFQKFAEALPRAIGNPLYHWCHLELKNYFGYTGVLSGGTAQEVWDLTRERLGALDLGVRGLIAQSRVAFIGTTDDPIDSLEWHAKLAADPAMTTIVAPTFRPDKALNIDKAGWRDYMSLLGQAAGVEIDGLDALETALSRRMEHFAAHGCRASDHGLDRVVYAPASREQADAAVKKAMAGQSVSPDEAAAVKTALLRFCAGEYVRLGWVMQLHFNCLRNPNSAMFARLGPDSGFDCIGPDNGSLALAGLLDSLYAEDRLPRTVLYSLDPGDNAFLDTLIGSFQGPDCPGKLQHGSAWWFNDNRLGIREQLSSLASQGLLGNFIGMLTDSRSFLSYARHEYFRRVLCDLLGSWVENGEYPADLPALGALVEDICCRNAIRYFRLEELL